MNYYIIFFSGGKDSTALLLEWLTRRKQDPDNYPLHEVIYCDTGMDFPQMYKHVDRIRSITEQENIKFTTLKSEKSFEYYMLEHLPKGRTIPGYSWPDFKNRWCTKQLKLRLFNKHVNAIRKSYSVIELDGLAADERNRLSRKNNLSRRHPLAEWGWSEKDCLEYCYKNGFDWGGLYKHFERVSCWCCPLSSLNELRSLWGHYPELWQKLKELDSRTWRSFRTDYTLDELEIRFALEQKRISKGLSINSHESSFRKALNTALEECRQ